MSKAVDQTKWYQNGLQFKCTGCGKCCTGAPGYVWINSTEAKLIASDLNLPIEEFYAKYTERKNGQYTLIEKKNFDCIFFSDNQCKIYKNRPLQCRTYPFWPQVTQSKESWDNEALSCEGINHKEGIYYSAEEISKTSKEASSWIH